MELFIEKYRPKEFEDVVGMEESIKNFITKKDIPHILLYGPAGTGKTTTAKIIIKKLEADCLVLNASQERGIGVIREKVSDFAMTASSNGNIKIVFLDEANGLTFDAQESLKNTMEKYSKNCRFILTTNHINKIAEPLQSRCVVYKLNMPPKEEVFHRLKGIVELESISISDDLINMIVDQYHPDIRACVNKLQELKDLEREITEKDVMKNLMDAKELLEKIIKSESFDSIRLWCLNSCLDHENIILQMYRYIMNNLTKYKNLGIAFKLLDKLVTCNRNINRVGNQDMEFEWMILGMLADVKKNISEVKNG